MGSPVKFRGVTIGAVSAIEVAPDHRHVDVVEELDAKEIKRMGLTEEAVHGRNGCRLAEGSQEFRVPPDRRAQLGSQGITGVKFIAIDFFDTTSNPLPDLPFKPATHYIPASPSLMKNLEKTRSRTRWTSCPSSLTRSSGD